MGMRRAANLDKRLRIEQFKEVIFKLRPEL